nr:hypothetical protein RVX_0655 [Nitratidesulfovibrio sp. HK-II]
MRRMWAVAATGRNVKKMRPRGRRARLRALEHAGSAQARP